MSDNIDYSVSEISARSPDMRETDFRAFVENIRQNGQLVPIWVRGSEVIDGRKRLAACRKLGLEPVIVNLDPTQKAEDISRALNVLRTHYTTSQLASFSAERATATKRDGPPRRDGIITKNGDDPPMTIQQAAEEVGVSPSYVIEAKFVRRVGAPEVFEAVKRGRLTLHAAKQIVQQVPKDEQSAAVEQVIAASQGKSRHTPVAKVLGTDVRRDRAMPKPAHEQFARAVQMLDVAAEIISKHAKAASGDIRRREFIETLRAVRTHLSRVISDLEAAA